MAYNSGKEYFIFPTTAALNCTGESLYSCGEASLYSANTYNRLDTPGSPSQGWSAFSPALLATLDGNQRYPVNQQGRTYGSALLSGVVGREPDLISAEGTGGVCGYVLSHDLSPDITTPEEAVAYMAAFEDHRVLPLYDLNETVIGTFVLSLGIDPSSKEFDGCDLAAAQAKVESGAYTEPRL